MKYHEATKPAFNVGPASARQRNAISLGHHRSASETPFKLRSLAGRIWPAFSAIWILSPLIKKKLSELDPHWQNFLDPRHVASQRIQDYLEGFFKFFSNINEVLSGEQEKESIIRVRMG